jgi:hypothetical protein
MRFLVNLSYKNVWAQDFFYLEKAKNKKGKRKKKKKKIYVKRNIETTVPLIFYPSSYKIYLESIKD